MNTAGADYIIESGGPATLIECDTPEQGKRLSRYVDDLAEALWRDKEQK